MTFPAPTDHSEALITANMLLARQQAWKFHRKTGQPYDDLEAIAFVGLIRGCRKYDPERLNPATGRSYALSTIVVPFIVGEILHHFRDRGHAIKFPSRWREQWGRVQRLMADPEVSTNEVAEQAGMTPEELAEMLGAMGGTANLDDHHGADATPGPEIEIHRLGPLQLLIRQAWGNLHTADQGLLVRWWADQRRHAYPTGPMQQFHRRLQRLLGGQRLSQVQQLGLALEVEPVEVLPKPPRRRSRQALETAAVQLGLLVG